MKILFDLFPILLFFLVFKVGESNEAGSLALATVLVGSFVAGGALLPDQGPIMLATISAIVASVGQISYLKLRGRKVDFMLWVSFGVIAIFGGLTIYFHNPLFIMWKPTIIYWLQAGAILMSFLVFRKNLIREIMEEQITLPDPVWDRMCLGWVAAFFFLGALNLLAAFVVFKGNTSAWVSFKLFGMNGLLLILMVVQGLYLSKYMEEEKT
ncbi:MAG: septation protein A [Massilia sp.]